MGRDFLRSVKRMYYSLFVEVGTFLRNFTSVGAAPSMASRGSMKVLFHQDIIPSRNDHPGENENSAVDSLCRHEIKGRHHESFWLEFEPES